MKLTETERVYLAIMWARGVPAQDARARHFETTLFARLSTLLLRQLPCSKVLFAR